MPIFVKLRGRLFYYQVVNYYKYSSMKIHYFSLKLKPNNQLILKALFLLCFIIETLQQGNTYSFLTGMQQTNETFMRYIPFIQNCNYNNNSNISPGLIVTEDSTPENLFEYYKNAERIAFWSSIENGLDIFMVEKQLLQNYDGIIYRPQIFNQDENNLSLNSTNDIVTLFNTDSNGNLTIFFVEVYVEMNNNFNLSQTIVQQINLTMSTDMRNVIINCHNNAQSSGKIVISQLAIDSYIGTCLQTSDLFFFSLGPNTTDTILNLSNYNMSMPITNMLLNPILQIFNVTEVGWNVFLLTNHSQQTYSCDFNPLSINNFTCLNSTLLSEEFQQLIAKLWSEESNLLEIKLEKLITHLGPNAIQNFPGKINSIFIDPNDNVYVQSSKNATSYLNVFNWEKERILNISFPGRVLLYNQLRFLVQDYSNLSTYTIMSINLPMLSFNIAEVVNNTFSSLVPCNDGIDNLVIQIQLFMSNIEYPTSYTFQLEQPNLYSNMDIYTFELLDYFTVFGPGYTVYYKGPDVMQATLLDGSIISMNSYIFSIVEIIVSQSVANTIFRSSSILYTTQNGIYIYNGGKNGHTKIFSSPCGIKFKLKGLKISTTETIYYGYQTDSQTQLTYCICPGTKNGVIKCQKVEKPQARSNVWRNQQKISKKIEKLSKLGLLSDNDYKTAYEMYTGANSTNYINNRLFTIVDQQMVVTLYNNNSAILSNFVTGQFYDQVNLTCNLLDQIMGTIFVKEFYDPSLYLFCMGSGFLYQYKIRYAKFIFQRAIPLYGFVTRGNSSNLLMGVNYIYIEVDVDLDVNQSSSINVNPQNPYCCVLRIDPLVDTVSSIKEVIFSKNIQQVYNYAGTDVAYYQGSQVTEDDSFLKIYLDKTWLALNLTSYDNSVEIFNFEVVFASINYNLASEFSVNITYNMTSMTLTEESAPLSSTIYLQQIDYSSQSQAYTAIIQFDYNGIEGPIITTNISSSNTPQMIEDVELNELIVQRKILGTVGNTYLQIFTPMHGKSNTSFDNSIIVVGSDSLQVYLKNFNNQEMYLVSTFSLNYPNCQYFPYLVLNSTSIEFVSECILPEFNFQIPILTLTLNIGSPTSATLGANLVLGSVKIGLSNMTNLKTLVFQEMTLALGMDKGPMESLTGKLQYCSSLGYCSALYISSKQQFLLYYDVIVYDENQFIVVTLDFNYILIWLTPSPPTNISTDLSIPSNFTINLSQYIDDNISIVTLVYANSSAFTAVLSGTQAYYEVVYFYGEQLTITTVFQRYGNCEKFDRFPVNVLIDPNNQVEALIAQCNQNQNTLRLQTYERINSTSAVIFTGYLQYFTRYGPVSYLATAQTPSYNPIRLLSLSNTMINKLFMLYKNDKNQIKLVYQQIDGILADNYVYLNPSLQITLSPLTLNINFPTLQFTIQNDFYQLSYLINTQQAPLYQLTTMELAFLIVFIICNFFSLIVMIFFWIYQRQKEPKRLTKSQSFNSNSWKGQEPIRNTFQDFKNKFKERISGISILPRKQTMVRKQTQIELFTRRLE